jgi:hypothetical protein
MASRNVFRFVSLRPPKYTPPEPDPVIVNAVFIPPDSSVPLPGGPSRPQPVPVPIVTDPQEERRFVAAVEAAAGVAGGRASLVQHATTFRGSAAYFSRDRAWRRLRPAEGALRAVIAAAGPRLPLAADARWVTQVDAVLARVFPNASPLARWLDGEELRALRATLWQSLYALSALGGGQGAERASIMFWLRLFAALEAAFLPAHSGGELVFRDIGIGVPAGVTPRRPQPDQESEDPAAEETERRERMEAIAAEIAALERAIDEIEAFGDQLPPPIVVRRYIGVTGPIKLSRADRPAAQESPSEGETRGAALPPSPVLAPDNVASETVSALEAAGIRWRGRSPDDVIEDIEGRIESLEGENARLSTRSIVANRGGVFVRRLVSAD